MLFEGFGIGTIAAIAVVGYIIFNIFRIVPQYERLVIFRLGKLVYKAGGHGPGLVIVLPIIDQVRRVSIRTSVVDVPPQDIITKDNVTLQVNAVIYYRVVDPEKSINEVEDYMYATGQLAQTTLRSVCGQMELDELLGHRDEINERLQKLLDAQTEPWGVKIGNVELKNVDLPKDLQRAIGRQAEAERERRAKVIAADGELEASVKLSQAAHQMSSEPNTLQLRYLQTLVEISGENTKTIIFPVPMDLINLLEKASSKS
jgi:regulator of protease activity HflC (stomatin/prohibitin superfamily)